MTQEKRGEGGTSKVTIKINPGAFTGGYFYKPSDRAIPNPTKLDVSPGGKVSLMIYATGMETAMLCEISFSVTDEGRIDASSIEPPDAASGDDTTLTFKTREVTIQPGKFNGGYKVSGFEKLEYDAVKFNLVTGLECYLEFYRSGYNNAVFAKVPAIGPVTSKNHPGAISGQETNDGKPTEILINSREFKVMAIPGIGGTIGIGNSTPQAQISVGSTTWLIKNYPIAIHFIKLSIEGSIDLGKSPGDDPFSTEPLFTFEPV